MRRSWTTLLVLLMAPAFPACIEDLPSGILLERPRLLGVRVAIADDPERAEPMPGETVSLQWIVAPDEGAWASAVSACATRPSINGLPECAGEPFAAALTEPSPNPSFDFTIPPQVQGSALVLGVLCESGRPELSGELPGCEGEGATVERLLYTLPLATPGRPPNLHPRIASAPIFLDEEPWPAPPEDLTDGPCRLSADGEGLPLVTARGEEDPSMLRFELDPSQRERYDELVLGDPPSFVEREEDLVLTHISTAGRFARLTTEVFDEESANAQVAWRHTAPEDVPEDGQLVRFVFVLRDVRGGMDRADRALCLVP